LIGRDLKLHDIAGHELAGQDTDILDFVYVEALDGLAPRPVESVKVLKPTTVFLSDLVSEAVWLDVAVAVVVSHPNQLPCPTGLGYRLSEACPHQMSDRTKSNDAGSPNAASVAVSNRASTKSLKSLMAFSATMNAFLGQMMVSAQDLFDVVKIVHSGKIPIVMRNILSAFLKKTLFKGIAVMGKEEMLTEAKFGHVGP